MKTYGFVRFSIQRKTILGKQNFGGHDFENENIRIFKNRNSKKNDFGKNKLWES